MQETNHHNEKELLQQVSEGSGDAFRILFLHYGPQLQNYLIKLSRSRETAEDLVHDVFLEIWKNRTHLNEIEHFRPYLFRAVQNRAHRSFQRQAREHLLVHELRKDLHSTTPSEGEERLTGEEVRLYLQRIIDKLTPQQKKVFLLSRDKGLSHKEIAQELGLSTQTVSNHLTDALRFIREEIGSSFGNYTLAILILHRLS